MNTYSTALWVWIGFVIGNIIYSVFSNHDWRLVAERSYFQGVACFIMAFVLSEK